MSQSASRGAANASKTGYSRRVSVDLAAYPDLVVIYLGMMAHSFKGFRRLLKIGPEIQRSVKAAPEGLLLHEDIIFGFKPLHLGMRQYWRDFDALEAWARSGIHLGWWREFMQDSQDTGFWHEVYFMRGGMEALYNEMPKLGMQQFAPVIPARGSMFSARRRLKLEGEETVPMPYSEAEVEAVYGEGPAGKP